MVSDLGRIKPQHDVVLNTERLRLRPVLASDLAAIHKMRLNPAVMQFMSSGTETELIAEKSFSVRRIELMMRENMFSFAIETRPKLTIAGSEPLQGDLVVGFVGITHPPALFYIFDQDHWGQGYATEALRAFLDGYWVRFPKGLIGVKEEERDVLEANVYKGNAGSEKVAVKCGFENAGDRPTEAQGKEVTETVFRLMRPK